MAQPIKIAILAMGGEGGGVLADWIVDLGENAGFVAQTTSVPGVAQRTGATLYYVELFDRPAGETREPVLALMPLPGDVDVVLASELMEAGRAVQRGLVTRDRTTLIASTHRVYSIAEKSALGDGRVDSDALLRHAAAAARRFIRFDMARAAEDTGSVVSAILFGALAGAGALPFDRAAFEATIRRGGVGVGTSLAAFARGFELARADAIEAPPPLAAHAAPQPAHPAVRALVDRVERGFAAEERPLLFEGLRRLVDYQDATYAGLYLDRMEALAAIAPADGPLLRSTARHLALWMSYEDTARVADLKIRGERFERVRGEARVGDGELLIGINEYLHPRLQEVCETLPAALGRRLLAPGLPRRVVERLTRRGRVVRTNTLRGYLLLSTVAAMRRWRRTTLRYAEENRRIEAWLRRIAHAAARDPGLALELAECQRLVKGYSDTHERGVRHYDAVMDAFDRGGLSAGALRELRDAALADEHGDALRTALGRHARVETEEATA